MVRGHCVVDVTRPKLPLVGVAFGRLNCGWFSAFTNSVRNCTRKRSFTVVFFTSEMSQLFNPSPRIPVKRVENVRILLLSCLLEFRSKPAAVLNHCVMLRLSEESGTSARFPVK